MKKLLFAFITGLSILSLTNCTVIHKYKDHELKIYKDAKGNKNITGNFSLNDLLKYNEFSTWYNQEYKSYSVSDFFKTNKKPIRKLLIHKRIDIFMGTWCSDSRREVPRFMKIMDFLEIPHNRIRFIGVNRQKQAFSGEELGKRIIRVPTFIFYERAVLKNPIEIGRIVESPVESLEKDLYNIISGKPYKANYAK